MARQVSSSRRRTQKRQDEGVPWVPLLLLITSIYVFWILPIQWGSAPVRVEFAGKE